MKKRSKRFGRTWKTWRPEWDRTGGGNRVLYIPRDYDDRRISSSVELTYSVYGMSKDIKERTSLLGQRTAYLGIKTIFTGFSERTMTLKRLTIENTLPVCGPASGSHTYKFTTEGWVQFGDEPPDNLEEREVPKRRRKE